MAQLRQKTEDYLNPGISTLAMPNESLDEDLKREKWFEDVYLPWALELVSGVNEEGWNYRLGKTPSCLTFGEADAYARKLFPGDIRQTLQPHTEECRTCDKLVEAFFQQLAKEQAHEQPQHPITAPYTALYRKAESLYHRLLE